MSIELTVQLIAYAVLVTAVIVTMRADAKRNREVVLEMKKYLDSHAANMLRLDEKVQHHSHENAKGHAEILTELGRLGGKIDNGGKGGR